MLWFALSVDPSTTWFAHKQQTRARVGKGSLSYTMSLRQKELPDSHWGYKSMTGLTSLSPNSCSVQILDPIALLYNGPKSMESNNLNCNQACRQSYE